jgi:hypothetical protein
LKLLGNGDLWVVRRAEMTNFRGFSSGLFNFVIVPESAQYQSPSLAMSLISLIALLIIGLLKDACPPRYGTLWLVASLTAYAVFAVVWLIPLVSPYRALLAVHTWLLVCALLYLPVVERLSAPLTRSAAAVVSVVVATRAGIGKQSAPSIANRDLVVSYLLLLLFLMATSVPRTVGDGPEYLRMTSYFAAGSWPPVETSRHFWLYSALTAPLAAAADLFSLGSEVGFAAFNMLLLASAFAVVLTYGDRVISLLLFLGPILWWVDKVHAEVFMFSLLAIAMATLRDKPWWSLVALGLAAAQNPPVALLLPVAVLVTLATTRHARDRRFWMASVVATGLALLHPVYFLTQVGRPVPLLDAGRPTVPAWTELVAVLSDTNIGLLVNFPPLFIGLGLVVLSRRRWRPTGDAVFAAAAAAVFLFSFAQTTNFNHGGTRDMSRYCLWLTPLAIPWLRLEPEARPAWRRAMGGLTAASALYCIASFHPVLSERSTSPTWTASTLWTRFPSWTNPLPEIFVERLQGAEFPWWLPIATGGCEKVLMKGQGDSASMWPSSCSAVPVPPHCVHPGALCYANRRATGAYGFEQIRAAPEAGRYRLRRQNLWNASTADTAARLRERLAVWAPSSDLELPEERLVLGLEPVDESLQVASRGITNLRWFAGSGWIVASIPRADVDATLFLRAPKPVVGEVVKMPTGEFVDSLDHSDPSQVFGIPITTSEPLALILRMIE